MPWSEGLYECLHFSFDFGCRIVSSIFGGRLGNGEPKVDWCREYVALEVCDTKIY